VNRVAHDHVVQDMKRIVAFLLLVAGCGTPLADTAESAYTCHDRPIPLDVMSTGRPATQLGPDGRAALKGHEVRPVKDLDTWRIVEETGERVALIKEFDEPQERGNATVTHDFLVVERFGPPAADGRPSWHMRSSGGCNLQRDLGDLGVAEVTLDAARPATGNSLHLLVTEQACVSGQSADGRIRVVGLEETDRDVRLVIGVERAPGDVHNCLGNPATPYTVELSRPLGDRVPRDAGLHPMREIVKP
jgi:hypothetical protein